MKHVVKRKAAGILTGLALCGALLMGTQAWATEGGGGAYPNGAEDFMVGALPPPGTYFINYLNYYTASGFKDNNGDNMLPKFNLDVYANVFRFIHVTKETFLGGSWGMHLFVPIVHMGTEVRMRPEGPDASGNRTGFGDVIVDPFILGWHWKNFHLTTGMDTYIPTGSFNANPLTPLGRNYWTFEPIVAGTYITDSGFQVSTKLMYDFNTVNMDTSYRSGQEFHLDYVVGQKIKNFDLGVGGYYYQQTTEDTAPFGQHTNGKGMVLSVGPAIKYDYKNMSFTGKYYYEVEAKNRPQGSSIWAKFMYAF
jgi:hypothetical protein